MGVWHYTVGVNIIKIIECRSIRPSTEGIPKREQPAVWFSTNPDWEQTANKAFLMPDGGMRILSKNETARFCNGLFRIEVYPKAAPYNWNDFTRRSGISPKLAKGLVLVAINDGSDPETWRVSFKAVPMKMWKQVERWNGKRRQWMPYEG